MRLRRLALFLSAFWLAGCADVEQLWARAHEDRLATLEGQCRASGFVPGSSEFVRCVRMKDEDPGEGDQADSCELVEVARADGTTYSKANCNPLVSQDRSEVEGQVDFDTRYCLGDKLFSDSWGRCSL